MHDKKIIELESAEPLPAELRSHSTFNGLLMFVGFAGIAVCILAIFGLALFVFCSGVVEGDRYAELREHASEYSSITKPESSAFTALVDLFLGPMPAEDDLAGSYIRGKLVVIERDARLEDGRLHRWHREIPLRLRAFQDHEVQTIVWVEKTLETVGRHSGGGRIKQEFLTGTVIDRNRRQIVGRFVLRGYIPEEVYVSVSSRGEDYVSLVDVEDFLEKIDYIARQPVLEHAEDFLEKPSLSKQTTQERARIGEWR